MPEISQPTQKLIQKYLAWHQSLQPKKGVPLIHVDEVASAVASFYEKIRGVVDWKEEHLLRRAAIGRVLKRRFFLQKSGEEIAEPLVLELIRSGHFPNDRIEEAKIEQVKNTLNKYLFLLQEAPQAENTKSKVRLYDWLMDVAACEIEEILEPPVKEKALMEYMTELMTERIEVAEEKIFYQKMSPKEKETQIFIACQRALFKLDSPIISYYLLQRQYPDWSNLSAQRQKEIAARIYLIWNEIEKALNHRLVERFYKICEKQDTAYLILGDIIAENPSMSHKNLSNPEILENLTRHFYQLRLKKLKSRVTRAAIFSTISIFITKVLVALAIEIPFDKYVLGHFNYQTLGFNILIPPLLMFFLVLTIKPPQKENLDRVIMEVIKITYHNGRKDVWTIKPPRKRGFILGAIIAIFYVFIFFLSFGAIIWFLNKLNFSILSMVIFLMFFSLIAFAGVKIRERAKELNMIEGKAGLLSFLMDSFSLPFLRAGRWLSSQLAKYNIVLILITAFIDMPFQLFTEFLEHWRTFLKEKKEEIH